METPAGWNIVRAGDAQWAPWGSQGNAEAKVLGTADGYYITLVEADAGSRGDPTSTPTPSSSTSSTAPCASGTR